MEKHLQAFAKYLGLLILGFMVMPGSVVVADDRTYREAFLARVNAFGSRNRIDIRMLNRDVHADCYIPLTLSTVIRSDGTVADVAIVESSTVPVVDRWYRWVIEQAAPYAALADHYDPVPDKVTITEEFRLDVRLWSENIRSTRPCDPLKPRVQQPD